ncbi:MAG: 4Fe-4S dicluster domain-containing protein [Lachnospiraceae bacterium]|nr:4Fe-4S dicluster domain-containing protein [Lachnospiraceae bacterium]
MSFVNFTKTELKNLFKKPATEKYPEGPATYKETTRGHIVNNMDTCVLCSVCQMRCPTRAITVDRKAQTWTIRPFSCIQCRRCVDNCPKKSLSMAKEYTEPDVTRTEKVFALSDRQKAALAEQARRAAERAAAAMEAKKKEMAEGKKDETKKDETKKDETKKEDGASDQTS